MFAYNSHPGIYQPPAGSGTSLQFSSADVKLDLRQQPKEALITTEGKEKARKPVDPPPIIQLHVDRLADPSQHYLQSPYLFVCTSLYKGEHSEEASAVANKCMTGSLVSSLHRLKDVDNKDGAFFVFGDISIKTQGTFRFKFSLFDLRKNSNDVQYLGSIMSEPFKVLLAKDFKGMEESTYLSRAFSDQGVRLRLRKEPRAMMGSKRSYPYDAGTPSSTAPLRSSTSDFTRSDDPNSPTKRYRTDTEDRKDSYTGTTASSTPLASSFALNRYSAQSTSLSSANAYSAAPYQSYSSSTSGTARGSSPFSTRVASDNSPAFYGTTTPGSTIGRGIADPLSTPSRYSGLQQSYGGMYPSYAQQHMPHTALSFANDSTGLGNYRTSDLGAARDYRTATSSAYNPSLSSGHGFLAAGDSGILPPSINYDPSMDHAAGGYHPNSG